MMLAQSIDALPANTLKDFLWAGAALVIIAYYVKGLFWSEKNPQPFDVRGTPMSNAEMQRDLKAMNHRVVSLENWRGALMTKLDTDKNEMMEAGEDRARRITANVDEVRRELDAKIREVPTSVIAILRDTGAI